MSSSAAKPSRVFPVYCTGNDIEQHVATVSSGYSDKW